MSHLGKEEREIRKIAYALWMEQGQPEGRDHEHWEVAKEIWNFRNRTTEVVDTGAEDEPRSSAPAGASRNCCPDPHLAGPWLTAALPFPAGMIATGDKPLRASHIVVEAMACPVAGARGNGHDAAYRSRSDSGARTAGNRTVRADFPGGQAFAIYRSDGDRIVVTHTEVPPAFNGRGLGSQLAEGIFRIARQSGRRVVPRCSFVADWARRHPHYNDVLA